MEIRYDEGYNLRFRLDDGREFTLADLLADLEKIEKLEAALTLTKNSREWNRKRVLELEDQLEQGTGEQLYTAEQVGDLQASEAQLVAGPLRNRIAELERTLAASIDREEKAQQENHALTYRVAELDRDLHTERDLADKAKSRVAELERLLAQSVDRGDRLVASLATSGGETAESRIVDLERTVVQKSRRIVELGHTLAESVGRGDRLAASLAASEGLVRGQRIRADNLEQRLAAEKEKARRRNDQHDRTLSARDEETRQRIEARDNLLNQATTRINAAQEILSRPAVVGARNEIVTTKGAILADAIGNALDALEA